MILLAAIAQHHCLCGRAYSRRWRLWLHKLSWGPLS